MNKFVSRKLLVALVSNAIALYLAFGGHITTEQTAAVLALVNSVYLVAQALVDFKEVGANAR